MTESPIPHTAIPVAQNDDQAPKATISPYTKILEWSHKQKLWLKDALRRLVLASRLTQEDFDAIRKNFLSEFELEHEPVSPEPLQFGDLPHTKTSNNVSLVSLRHHHGVNRLHGNQYIEFSGTPGLTVIFGGNGTGKSGYARLIKMLAQTRGSFPVIQKNRFADNPLEPKLKLMYRIGREEPREFKWTAGAPLEPLLKNIAFFDGDCVALYSQKDGETAFIPDGLDVLPRLANVMAELAGELKKSRETHIKQGQQARNSWQIDSTTQAGEIIHRLDADSSIEEIETLASLSSEEESRLDEISTILANRKDSEHRIQTLRASIQRLENLASSIQALEDALSSSKVTQYRQLVDKQLKAQTTADTARRQFDGIAVSKHVGSETWKELWLIAKRYATEAEILFPPLESNDGSYCPLCERPFDHHTRDKVIAFDHFVANEAQRGLLKAKNDVISAREELASLYVPFRDLDGCRHDFSDVDDALIFTHLHDGLRRLDNERRQLVSALTTATLPQSIEQQESLSAEVQKRITVLCTSLTLREKGEEEGHIAQLESERDELRARKELHAILPQVKAHIDSQQHLRRVGEAIKALRPNPITKESDRLYKQFATEALFETFEEEIQHLGVKTIRPRLIALPRKATRKVGIRLDPEGHIESQGVASEGESKCLALASFFAELSQASHTSTIVLDDPVCSLDHSYTSLVAERLIKEASKRQVIIFTHDAVFFSALNRERRQNEQACTTYYVEWDGKQPGLIRNRHEAWEQQKAPKRLDVIRQKIDALDKRWNPVPSEENRQDMENIYSRLRETMERVVKDVILAGVVRDFNKEVTTRHLVKVVAFDSEFFKRFDKQYSRVCDFINGHDASVALQDSFPDPDRAKKEVNELDNFIKDLGKEQSACEKPAKKWIRGNE